MAQLYINDNLSGVLHLKFTQDKMRSMKIKDYFDLGHSQTSLAKALGVTPAQVNHWVSGLRPIPLERMTDIERATDGLVTRRDLCPDEWQRHWPELAKFRERTERIVSSVPGGLLNRHLCCKCHRSATASGGKFTRVFTKQYRWVSRFVCKECVK